MDYAIWGLLLATLVAFARGWLAMERDKVERLERRAARQGDDRGHE